MKFTQSNTWNVASTAASKVVVRSVYIRKVTDISLPVTGVSGWTDITDKISEIDSPRCNVEYQLGQFSADSINVSCGDITFFSSNIFDVISDTNYVELKLVVSIGLDENNLATDECIIFSGFIDKDTIEYDEITDSVRFSVYTAQELGNRLKTQDTGLYLANVNADIDGNFTNGMIMRYPGLYIVNQSNNFTTIPSPSMGYHKFTLECNNSASIITRTLQMDDNSDGARFITSSGYYLLNDNEDNPNFVVSVYCATTSSLPNTGSYLDAMYIGNNSGLAMIPSSSVMFDMSIDTSVKKLYSSIGISNVSISASALTTHDSRAIVNYIDNYNTSSALTYYSDLAVVSGSVYFGGSLLYKNETGSFEQLVYGIPTASVSRLWYNDRNKDLWICYGTQSAFGTHGRATHLTKYNITNKTSASIQTWTDYQVQAECYDLMDYQYSPGNYKYGMYYIRPTPLPATDGGEIMFVTSSGSALTQSREQSGHSLLYNTASGYGMQTMHLHVSQSKIRVSTRVNSSTYKLHGMGINGSGVNIDEGYIGAFNISSINTYNPIDNCIYQLIYPTTIVGKFPITTGVVTSSGYSLSNGLKFIPELGAVYGFGMNATSQSVITKFDGASCTATEIIKVDNEPNNAPFTIGASTDGTLYGTTRGNKIFKVSSTFTPQFGFLDTYNLTVNECINKILHSYNMAATITPDKKVKIISRSDISGNIVTSGDTLICTEDNTENIVKTTSNYRKVSLIKITNPDGIPKTVYFDGTNYLLKQLKSNEILMELESTIIPQNLMEDMANVIYQFLKYDRVTYKVNHNYTNFNYEVFDGGQLLFPNRKLAVSTMGVIYSVMYNLDGTMEIEVIV